MASLADLQEFVRRGRAAQAEIDEILRRRGEAPVVHHLHQGVTPCRMPSVPVDWPPGHEWSGDWPDVTCPRCLLEKPEDSAVRFDLAPSER
jgi:hypothetical protein